MSLLSSEGLEIIQIVVRVALGGAVCFLGIVLNIINIYVFWKQGLGQTVNISMFAIAVSDLCSLVTIAWVNINLNSFIENADILFDPGDISYLSGTWPHCCFLQITIWITVYVTAERFVCIALPLKVKQIFPPLRTKVAISLIYLLTTLTILPAYFYFKPEETFNPTRNQTRIGLKVRDMTLNLDALVYIMYVVLEITSFVALTVLTCLLVFALKRRLKWRMTFSADINQCQVTSRSGTRTMKMVGLIAGVQIVCCFPGVLLSFAEIRDLYFLPHWHKSKLFLGLCSFVYLIEAFHATVNTVLFYKTSSKYKQHFRDILSGCAACCHGNHTTNRGSV